MNDKDLKLLDFILPILSEKYPDGADITLLAYQYTKINSHFDDDYKYIEMFKNIYVDKYFSVYKNSDYITIIPETKQIIDNYESLSKYLKEQENESKKPIISDRQWDLIKMGITAIISLIVGYLLAKINC